MRTVSGRTDHVVVVGAGLAGLAAALHLIGAGRTVTVLERAEHPGGRAGRVDLDGPAGRYQVDTGPTVLTMPDLVESTLAAVGEKLGDRLELIQLDPAYQARFADGSTIGVHTDPDRMEAEIAERVGPADAAGYRRLRRWLTALVPGPDPHVHRREPGLAAEPADPGPGPAGRTRWVRPAGPSGRPVRQG